MPTIVASSGQNGQIGVGIRVVFRRSRFSTALMRLLSRRRYDALRARQPYDVYTADA